MSVHTITEPLQHRFTVDLERLALTGLAGALLLAAGLFVIQRAAGPSDGSRVGGSGSSFTAAGISISPQVGPTGGGSLVGGRLQTVAGRSVEAWAGALLDPTIVRPAMTAGAEVAYVIDAGAGPIERSVTLAPADVVTPLASEWGVLALALAMLLVGIALFARRPSVPAARALLIIGTGMFASSVPWALGLQPVDLVQPQAFWLYAATAGLAYSLFWCGALHLALVFPQPMPFVSSPRRTMLVAYALPLGAQLALILAAGLEAGRATAALQAWLDGQVLLQLTVIVLALGLMTFSYWRLVDPIGRQQLRWVAAAVVLVALGSLALWFGPEAIQGEPLLPRSVVALLGLPFPIALGVAISRHHLFRLDGLVRRSVVYGGLSLAIIVTYAATVVAVSALIPGEGPFAATLLGAGAVALVALPLRDRLQRTVDRALYGDRSDPYRAVRRLGERLEATMDPRTVLPTLVEQVAESLRLPYVGIELDRDGEVLAKAETGDGQPSPDATPDIERLPIAFRGQRIGWLAVARRDGEPFSDADRGLLSDLLRQAAPAAEAVRLTADLQRSREQVVATREEERRRLRRDLHDGLGPTLVASLMKLQAARTLARSEPQRSRHLLAELETDARRAIDEVRRMAYDLRPPTLDDLGLVGALRQHASNLSEASDRQLDVQVEAPQPGVPLPAAVEVASFRIALEGLTNVARHSGACHAKVRLTVDDRDLVVEVADDGSGIPGDVAPGIGLTSMRERAEELGGRLDLERPPDGGTRVVARLPLGAATP